MARDPQSMPAPTSMPRQPLFTQVEVSAAAQTDADESEQIRLLRDLRAGQERQNELLEELVTALSSAQRQRASELAQWKQANPLPARDCRSAAEILGRVQTEYLSRLTDEVCDNPVTLDDSEFMLNEFVDRFGPRLAHLHSVLQVLTQLSGAPEKAR